MKELSIIRYSELPGIEALQETVDKLSESDN